MPPPLWNLPSFLSGWKHPRLWTLIARCLGVLVAFTTFSSISTGKLQNLRWYCYYWEPVVCQIQGQGLYPCCLIESSHKCKLEGGYNSLHWEERKNRQATFLWLPSQGTFLCPVLPPKFLEETYVLRVGTCSPFILGPSFYCHIGDYMVEERMVEGWERKNHMCHALYTCDCLILTGTLQNRCHSPHFSDKETEAHEGYVICLPPVIQPVSGIASLLSRVLGPQSHPPLADSQCTPRQGWARLGPLSSWQMDHRRLEPSDFCRKYFLSDFHYVIGNVFPRAIILASRHN